jgi:hemolysin III
MRRWIKDPFPGLSHACGVLLSIAALVSLLIVASGRPWYVVSFTIYGSTLIFLYLASTLAHWIYTSAPQRGLSLDDLDRMAIYLLIAGTYTPVCLISLRGPWGWSLFGVEWGLAALGVASVSLMKNRAQWTRTILYVVMGWMGLVFAALLRRVFPTAAMEWLLAGGLIYTVGAVVFVTNRPRLWPGRFVAHDLWHLMALAGSACHFVMVFRYVA